MELARNILSALALLLLGGGYVGSQLFASKPTWAMIMDQPQIRLLAWIIMLGAVVMFLLPQKPTLEDNP